MIYINSKEETIPFGKYKCKTIKYIMDNDPQYICWLKNNVKIININRNISDEAFRRYMKNKHIPNFSYSKKRKYTQYEDLYRTDYDSDFAMAYDLY